MKDEVIVRLKITSAIHDPEFISRVTAAACDKSWRIGDNRGNSSIREDCHGWILGSGLPKSTTLDEQLEALIRRVAPFRKQILEHLKGDHIEVSCVVYSNAAPALNFNSEIVSAISALGASLDIDLYI